MLTAKITAYNDCDNTYSADLIGGSVRISTAVFTDRDLEHMGNSVEFSKHHEGQRAKYMYQLYLNEKRTLRIGTSERQKEVHNMLTSLENLTAKIRDSLDWANSTHESNAFDMVTDLLVYQERFNK